MATKTNPKTEAQKALETINEYLAENETYTRSIAWYLHIYCRRGEGEACKFDRGALEYTTYFLKDLIRFFLNPAASKLFFDTNDYSPDYLTHNLLALQTLFEDLENDKVVMARIEQIEAGYFDAPCFGRTDKDMHNMQLRYAREKDLDSTKKRILNYYAGQFK